MDEQLKNIDIDYDPANDVLYCSFGRAPADAISVEESDGVFIRVHPETNKPVGVTIVDFSRRFTLHPGQRVTVALTSPVEVTA